MASSPLALGPRQAGLRPILQTIDVSRPPSPTVSHTTVDLKTRRSLNDAWKEAAETFKRETGRDLYSEGPSSSDSFLQAWAARSDHDDSEDVKKKRMIVTTVTNCLAGLSAIGSIVASAASIAFPGSGLCFSAISYLFKMPGRISAIYDSLLDLFSEIEEFLVRFKILKRIDTRQGLDTELVESASNMLLSFINICLLACKVLEKQRLKTIIKVAFKADPGIAGALTTFQGLAKKLDSLTTTLIFEHIRNTEEVVIKIENVVEKSHSVIKATDARMGTIEASFKEGRRKAIHDKRLTSIQQAIFVSEEKAMWEQIRQSPEPDINLLPNTFDVLEKQTAFQKWHTSAAHGAILALIGEPESGKSYVIESLKQRLEAMQRLAHEQDARVYAASHDLSPRRIKLAERNKKLGSFAPFALRSMAVQIAEQISSYAQELDQRLTEDKEIKEMTDLSRLWKVLGLSTFSTAYPVAIYLFFEGVEHENESSIEALLKILVEDRRAGTNGGSSQIRIVITGDAKVSSRLIPSVSKVDMDVLQKSLAAEYIGRAMKDLALFQGSDPRSCQWREKVVTKLQESEKRSFRDMKQKLERIQVAIRDDLVGEVDRILDDLETQSHNRQARELLDKVATDLRPAYVDQVNRIIAWILYSQPYWPFEVPELEAMLHIGSGYESLTSLSHKIDNDFVGILKISNDYVDLQDGLEDALRESAMVPLDGAEETRPLVSMNISIKNVDADAVRAFVSQLSTQISSHAFDFETAAVKHDNKIYANELRGHLDIVQTCLQLLNGGWSAHTQPLLYYSCEYLPLHLASLAQVAGLDDDSEQPIFSNVRDLRVISDSEARSIGQGLVSLLSDPHYLIDSKYNEFGTGENWLVESGGVSAIRRWLRVTRYLLQPHEQRWIDNVLSDQDTNNLKFMEDFVRALGKKWVTTPTGLTYQGPRLFSWVDKYIRHMQNTSAEVNGESTESSHQISNEGEDMEHEKLDAEQKDQPNDVPVLNATSKDLSNSKVGVEEASETFEHGRDAEQEVVPHCNNVTHDNGETDPIVDDSENVAVTDPIAQAISWLERERVEFTQDAKFHICVGHTYLSQSQPGKAIKFLEEAQTDPLHRGLALAGVATAQLGTGDKVKAGQTLLEAIAIHEEDQMTKDYEDKERLAYARFLNGAAVVLEELGDYKAAMTINEKATSFADGLTPFLKTLRLACKIERQEYALQLLSTWAQQRDGQDLRERLYRYVRGPDTNVFHCFVSAIHGQPLRDMVLSILESAINAAESCGAGYTKPLLMYLQGTLWATGLEEEYWQVAADLWERAIELITLTGQYRESGSNEVLYNAARSLAGYRFTSIRNRLLAQAEGLVGISEETVQRYHDEIIGAVLDLPVSRWERLDHPESYARSMSMILGRKDHGQLQALKTLQFALQTLTDDDSENDIYGYYALLKFMCFMGDKVGALTVLSLFDRQSCRAKNSDPAIKLSGVHDGRSYADTSSYTCDGCFSETTWFETEGSFACQFCPNFDLCAQCYRNFASGKLRLHMCSPTHVFIPVYHTEYSEEELVRDKVRIGWDWVDLGNDRFERRGGRIVELKEWLEELRTIWGLPSLATGDEGDA